LKNNTNNRLRGRCFSRHRWVVPLKFWKVCSKTHCSSKHLNCIVVVFLRITGNNLKVTCIGGSIALCESLLKHVCHFTKYVVRVESRCKVQLFAIETNGFYSGKLASFLYRCNSLNRLHHAGIQTEKHLFMFLLYIDTSEKR